MGGWRFWFLLLLLGFSALVRAEQIVVEGSAAINQGNLNEAREEAVRNALAEASRKAGFSVASSTGANQRELSFDQTVLRSAAVVQRHVVIAEHHDAEWYRVTIQAEIMESNSGTGASMCGDGYVKRVLIGGFPLLYPEHIKPGEVSGYAYLTAAEMARRFNGKRQLFVDYDGSIMVHYPEPERVVGDLPANQQALHTIRDAAERHRAQYLLLGRFRSLELAPGDAGRQLDMEVMLIDGVSGSCVARKRFSQKAAGPAFVPSNKAFASAAFFETYTGQAYNQLLSDVAQWVAQTASCEPFFARVVKVDGKAIYLDAGAEQGLSVGDTLRAFRRKGQPVVTPRGETLGHEISPVGELKITTVYPRFSIGELGKRVSAQPFVAGDLVYSH